MTGVPQLWYSINQSSIEYWPTWVQQPCRISIVMEDDVYQYFDGARLVIVAATETDLDDMLLDDAIDPVTSCAPGHFRKHCGDELVFDTRRRLTRQKHNLERAATGTTQELKILLELRFEQSTLILSEFQRSKDTRYSILYDRKFAFDAENHSILLAFAPVGLLNREGVIEGDPRDHPDDCKPWLHIRVMPILRYRHRARPELPKSVLKRIFQFATWRLGERTFATDLLQLGLVRKSWFFAFDTMYFESFSPRASVLPYIPNLEAFAGTLAKYPHRAALIRHFDIKQLALSQTLRFRQYAKPFRTIIRSCRFLHTLGIRYDVLEFTSEELKALPQVEVFTCTGLDVQGADQQSCLSVVQRMISSWARLRSLTIKSHVAQDLWHEEGDSMSQPAYNLQFLSLRESRFETAGALSKFFPHSSPRLSRLELVRTHFLWSNDLYECLILISRSLKELVVISPNKLGVEFESPSPVLRALPEMVALNWLFIDGSIGTPDMISKKPFHQGSRKGLLIIWKARQSKFGKSPEKSLSEAVENTGWRDICLLTSLTWHAEAWTEQDIVSIEAAVDGVASLNHVGFQIRPYQEDSYRHLSEAYGITHEMLT